MNIKSRIPKFKDFVKVFETADRVDRTPDGSVLTLEDPNSYGFGFKFHNKQMEFVLGGSGGIMNNLAYPGRVWIREDAPDIISFDVYPDNRFIGMVLMQLEKELNDKDIEFNKDDVLIDVSIYNKDVFPKRKEINSTTNMIAFGFPMTSYGEESNYNPKVVEDFMLKRRNNVIMGGSVYSKYLTLKEYSSMKVYPEILDYGDEIDIIIWHTLNIKQKDMLKSKAKGAGFVNPLEMIQAVNDKAMELEVGSWDIMNYIETKEDLEQLKSKEDLKKPKHHVA